MEILPVPKLKQEIKDAYRRNKLAIFIGAGVSRIAGCIGWQDLARDLIRLCATTKRKKDSEHPLINYKEEVSLLSENDHRKLITIAYQLLKKEGYEDDFWKKMEEELTYKQQKHDLKIYEILKKCGAVFITTNADDFFDIFFNNINIFYKKYDESKFKVLNYRNIISNNSLYHIHGTIKYPQSVVFTLKQYLEAYSDNKNLLDFLIKIFTEYTVLFIGYGLNELELLQYLLSDKDSNHKDNIREIKHFYLEGYFQGEDNIAGLHNEYFKNINVEVIPYLKDENGFHQLKNVLEKWIETMNNEKYLNLSKFKEIDELVI